MRRGNWVVWYLAWIFSMPPSWLRRADTSSAVRHCPNRSVAKVLHRLEMKSYSSYIVIQRVKFDIVFLQYMDVYIY